MEKSNFSQQANQTDIYTLPAESPVHGGNGALLHLEKCNRDIVFPQDKHNIF